MADGTWLQVAEALPEPVPRGREALGAALKGVGPALATVPPPRTGRTRDRWQVLRGLGLTDLVLARLAEGHLDALAILAEAGASAVPDALYGVWASTSGRAGLEARPVDGGWALAGRLRYCSGAGLLDRALVTARAGDGVRLFDVALRGAAVTVERTPWVHAGMAATETHDIRVSRLPVPAGHAVGAPDWYFGRPGFWVGGAGVAACWAGGVAGLVRWLREHLRDRDPAPHQLVHLAACHAGLTALDAALDACAAWVDAHPDDDHLPRALAVRHLAARTTDDVVDRTGRAVGPTPLVRDPAYAGRVADLTVYTRQQGAEKELERLGRSLLERS